MAHEATQSPRAKPILSWSSPEDSLWIASMAGESAGVVEFSDGHFVVRDVARHEIGSYSNLPDAKALIADRAQAPTLMGAVHNTLHHLSDSLAASLPKPTPQYHRSAPADQHH